jgi:hypothetical protein
VDTTGRITTAIMGLIIIPFTARIFTSAVVVGTTVFAILMTTEAFTEGMVATMGTADISPTADTVEVSTPEAAASPTEAAAGAAVLRTAVVAEVAGAADTGDLRKKLRPEPTLSNEHSGFSLAEAAVFMGRTPILRVFQRWEGAANE